MRDSPNMALKTDFVSAIAMAVKELYPDSAIGEAQIAASISAPKKDFGDISSSIPLRLAGIANKRPNEIAVEIISHIRHGHETLIKSLKESGGYINAIVDETKYADMVTLAVWEEGDRYGSSDMGSSAKVIAEFPAVNPNKPWHIGHLRNALIGDSVSDILEFCSYKVEREDYIDDLGLQVAQSLWGYLKLGAQPDKKFDQWLGEQYVEVNRRIESDDVRNEVAALLKALEEGTGEQAELGREISHKCVEAQYQTASSYGIYHDVMIWESDIVRARLLDAAIDVGLRSGALEKRTEGKNAGCIVVDLEKIRGFAKDFDNPEEHEKVIVRSDGTATYIAKDLAFHMWKLGILNPGFRYSDARVSNCGRRIFSTGKDGSAMDFGHATAVINIIGSEQRYAQLMLKAIIGLMGYEKEAAGITHIPYGLVSVAGGSLSGRQGGWIGDGKAYTADVLLLESCAKALEMTRLSKRISQSANVKTISDAIGRAAIKFEFLRVAAQSAVVFSWEKALSFEGISGPYCLYSYARARRVLEKGGYMYNKPAGHGAMATRGADFELIKVIGAARDAVEKAGANHSPSVIADYVTQLATSFSTFYEGMAVIGSHEMEFRLELVNAYAVTMKNMLGLLGIEVVEEM